MKIGMAEEVGLHAGWTEGVDARGVPCVKSPSGTVYGTPDRASVVALLTDLVRDKPHLLEQGAYEVGDDSLVSALWGIYRHVSPAPQNESTIATLLQTISSVKFHGIAWDDLPGSNQLDCVKRFESTKN